MPDAVGFHLITNENGPAAVSAAPGPGTKELNSLTHNQPTEVAPRPVTRADLTAAGLGWAESPAVPERHGALCFPGDRLVFIRPGLAPTIEAEALAGVLRRYVARVALNAGASDTPRGA